MIQVDKLLAQFNSLSVEQKRQKVINLLEAIHAKTGQFDYILSLFQKVEHVPSQLLLQTYTSIITYGDDVNSIKIREEMGKTAYKLEMIRKKEAQERIEEEKELKEMEQMIMEIER